MRSPCSLSPGSLLSFERQGHLLVRDALSPAAIPVGAIDALYDARALDSYEQKARAAPMPIRRRRGET